MSPPISDGGPLSSPSYGPALWNVVKSSHFRRFQRYKNVIFKGINLKLCTHAYQYVPQNIFYDFFENFKNRKFGEKKNLVTKYTF